MYSQYVENKGCEPSIKSTIEDENDGDEFKLLLLNIMSGSLYKDDAVFKQTVLFNYSDFHIWYYLKLSSFEYDKNAIGLPLSYKPFGLKDYQKKVKA